MEKRTMYPKTSRVQKGANPYVITEKLDGSNLVFFKKNGQLYIAQRNVVYSLTEALESDKSTRDKIYKGLYQFLVDNGEIIWEALLDDRAICGEWLGMGHIKYGDMPRFNMFAKGLVNDEMELEKLVYAPELLHYAFVEGVVPRMFGRVPTVLATDVFPTVEFLDGLYDAYCAELTRPCEGFVVGYPNGDIQKYVRYKSGAFGPHKS